MSAKKEWNSFKIRDGVQSLGAAAPLRAGTGAGVWRFPNTERTCVWSSLSNRPSPLEQDVGPALTEGDTRGFLLGRGICFGSLASDVGAVGCWVPRAAARALALSPRVRRTGEVGWCKREPGRMLWGEKSSSLSPKPPPKCFHPCVLREGS